MRVVDTLTPGQEDPFQDHPIGHDVAVLARRSMIDGRTLSFIYDNKPRTVEVHAIGTSTKDGSLVMRGYQVAGQASRPLPQWTLFTLAKVEGVALDFTDSEAPREGYAQGDKQMGTVLCEIAL